MLNAKKDCDKQHTQNWRSASLLNVDTKKISKFEWHKHEEKSTKFFYKLFWQR